MFTMLGFFVCFVAGIAVAHAYRDDAVLCDFAQAVLIAAWTPHHLAILLYRRCYPPSHDLTKALPATAAPLARPKKTDAA